MKTYRTVVTLPARSLLCCALAASLFAAAPAMAQSSNATLRGQVASIQAGTTVTATNVASGAVRRVNTGADGSYALVGLPPGTYKVDAGPGTEKTVTLSVASSVSLDLGAASDAPAAPRAMPPRWMRCKSLPPRCRRSKPQKWAPISRSSKSARCRS